MRMVARRYARQGFTLMPCAPVRCNVTLDRARDDRCRRSGPALLQRRLTEISARITAHPTGTQLTRVRELAQPAGLPTRVAAVVAGDPALDPLLMVAPQGSGRHGL